MLDTAYPLSGGRVGGFGQFLAEAAAGLRIKVEVGGVMRLGVIARPPFGRSNQHALGIDW